MLTTNEGPHYPGSRIHINMSDYRYHTYSIEILPHESRILIDGHVLRRTPDRLIPPGYPQYDYVTKAPRAPMNIIPAEFGPASTDSAYNAYFRANRTTCLGCDATGPYQLLDYVKVFDLPKDVIVPPFPH